MNILQTLTNKPNGKANGKANGKEKHCPKSTDDFCEKVVQGAKDTAERSKALAGKMQTLIDHGF